MIPVSKVINGGQSMGHSTLTKIINFIWFQTIWFLAILFEDAYLLIILALLALHILFSKHKLEDTLLGLGIGIYGSLVDGVLLQSGLFAFSNQFAWFIPYWLVTLWIAFGMMLRTSLDYLQGRYVLSAILGAISGPLSYIAGERLNAVTFPQSSLLTVTVLSVIWAMTVPLWLWINAKITLTFAPKEQDSQG